MSNEQTGIGAKPAVEAAGEIPEIGVGMLGYAFMGKAHSNAFHKIGYMTWPPPLRPRLVALAGRAQEAVPPSAPPAPRTARAHCGPRRGGRRRRGSSLRLRALDD